MSEQLTSGYLDLLERRANMAPGSLRGILSDLDMVIQRTDVLALVAALREAWAERGRVVAVTRHRDVTLTTYERSNASDEATGGGG